MKTDSEIKAEANNLIELQRQRNYLLLLQDARNQGILMAQNKHAILTKEEFHALALNTMLPVDVLEDKYRAYRNAYVVTANSKPGGWDA